MVVQSNNLNLIPGQISPRVNVSQYDKKSRTLTFSLYNGSQPFNISNGMAVTIEGTKPDNTGFQYAMIATAGSNVVSISIEQQMTVIAGDVPCEIVVSNAGKRLASANFILVVEPAALNENTIISETELPLIEEAAELAENIAIYVTTIHEDALKAEGYAVGKQNGVDVTSGSPYFHNNAKWHAEQASSSASTASTKASEASTSATNAASSASTATTKASQATSAASTATSKASEATTAAQTATAKASEASASAQTAQEAAESLIGEVVDSEPYVLRQGLGNLADMALVGGSVAWNQLVQNGNFASTSGWSVGSNTTFTASNNIGKVVPIDSSNSNQRFIRQIKAIPVNHKVLVMLELSGNNECTIGFYSSSWQDVAILTFNITNNKATYSQIASLSKDSANVGLYFSNSTEVNISNFMCIDLTQLFGSTIADYIYSLEQATAGAGVAWFRKYFSNLYYGYQPGKIESVNVASRKVVGKNLLPFVSSTNTKSNVTMIINKDNVKISGKANGGGVLNIYYDVLPKEILAGNTYKITWGSAINAFQVITYDSNDTQTIVLNTASAESTGGNTIIIPSNAVKLQVRVALTANNSYDATLYPMIRLANVEDSTYEPYQEWTADFDPSIQLRGIPKLVDNKLSYDGDIYTADGTVTRKYGIFNLGDYTWGKETTSSGYRFYAAESTIKNTPGASVIPNAICSKYPTTTPELTWTASTTKGVSVNITNHIIYIADSDYSDAEALKTSLSGVYLVAELATPTTESADPYQNPQRAFIDGTEEFIDAGVQSATRDVSIPVGNNTTYQLNETLPPTEDYVDGALKFKAAISALGTDESGRTTASRAYTTGEFFYKDGKMYKVLTSIAQGATFTVGTNCQQTTLFAELKALAQ